MNGRSIKKTRDVRKMLPNTQSPKRYLLLHYKQNLQLLFIEDARRSYICYIHGTRNRPNSPAQSVQIIPCPFFFVYLFAQLTQHLCMNNKKLASIQQGQISLQIINPNNKYNLTSLIVSTCLSVSSLSKCVRKINVSRII